MNEPPSPTVGAEAVTVVGADGGTAVDVDVDRWCRLAAAVLRDEGFAGELTLTFVDRETIAELNAEYMGDDGPTDVLSFPLDAGEPVAEGQPVLLGDVAVCPEIAIAQAADHAGTVVDELALLVVHGVLHVIGHDHAEPDETTLMRTRELDHLQRHHWRGPAPAGFRQEHAP